MDRDKFRSRWGFILACVGSAVGLANVWAFPYKLGANGGLSFLIPYILFVVLFGRIGLAAENAVGRRYRQGPLGVYKEIWSERGYKKTGSFIRWIPLLGTLLLAIGYAVVITYVFRALVDSFTGSIMTMKPELWFESISSKDFAVIFSHLALMVIVYFTLVKGASGIEKSNKVMMPLFFLLFLVLAVRIFFIKGADDGYKFIFTSDFSKLLDVKVWIAAMGQAFFSLSLVGTVMIVYGSYFKEDEDIVESASQTAFLDTMAALLATFVMIPATFALGFSPESGPKLLFVVLPSLLQVIKYGRIFSIILYTAIIFAGITSIQSMIDAVTDGIKYEFPKLKRNSILLVIVIIIFLVGIFIEPISKWSPWMNFVTIFIMPVGAIIGAVSWFWVMKKEDLLEEINSGSKRKHGNVWYNFGKYLYVPLAIILCLIAIIFQISF